MINKKNLLETTVPDDIKSLVQDTWNHHSKVDDATKKKISNAMNGGTFIHFPLDSNVHPDPEVVEHLTNNGYKIDDYKRGIASKKIIVGNPSKGIPHHEKVIKKSIGLIIHQTNAPEYVKKAYDNDPARTNANKSGLHVLISTTPLAIAGMSTGTSWNSCMNMKHPEHETTAKMHCRADSENGSHVAYLVHDTDKNAIERGEPDNPIARIVLKPFHSEDGTDTVFRPEMRQHGSGNTAFANSVNEWSKTAYPSKPNQTYIKNDNVYDDDMQTTQTELSDDDLYKHLKSGLNVTNNLVVPDSRLDDIVDKTLSGELPPRHVIRIANLSPYHVKKLANHLGLNSTFYSTLADLHGNKFSEKMINNHVNNLASIHGDSLGKIVNGIPKAILLNSKLPASVVDMIKPSDYAFVRRSKLQKKHLEKAISLMSIPGVKQTLHLASSDDLIKLGKYGLVDAESITKHPEFNKRVHDSLSETTSDHLASSKFSSINDVKDNRDLYLVAKNENIDHNTPDLKDLFMTHVKLYEPHEDDSTLLNTVMNSYSWNNEIPKSISRHMTDNDFDEFHKKRITAGFSDIHSHFRYADSLMHHVWKNQTPENIDHAADELDLLSDYVDKSSSEHNEKVSALVDELSSYRNILRPDTKNKLKQILNRHSK